MDFFDDGDRAMMRQIELSKNGNKGPKVIFLDLNMKYTDGWELLGLLNELELEVNVVILSSEDGVRAKARAEQEPLVKGYLTKPIDQSEIEDLIVELVS
jgi:CheY-like chemotaxis protein